MDWADLATLDLSRFDIPGGKEELAVQLKTAIQTIGFFYISNVGLSREQVDRQFAIGQKILELPEEEKLKHRANLEDGSYNGYRPLGSIEILPGLYDNVEFYNIFKLLTNTSENTRRWSSSIMPKSKLSTVIFTKTSLSSCSSLSL